MCESESGFESGFKAFLAGFGFGFGFRPQKGESGFGFKKIEVDSDSSGFGFEVSGFRSGFGFEMSGFAHHWYEFDWELDIPAYQFNYLFVKVYCFGIDANAETLCGTLNLSHYGVLP